MILGFKGRNSCIYLFFLSKEKINFLKTTLIAHTPTEGLLVWGGFPCSGPQSMSQPGAGHAAKLPASCSCRARTEAPACAHCGETAAARRAPFQSPKYSADFRCPPGTHPRPPLGWEEGFPPWHALTVLVIVALTSSSPVLPLQVLWRRGATRVLNKAKHFVRVEKFGF